MASDGSGGPKTGENRKADGGGGGGGGGGGSATAEPSNREKAQQAYKEGQAERQRKRENSLARAIASRPGARMTINGAVARGTGSRIARIRRGVSGASVVGQSSGGSRSPRLTARPTKKTRSTTEQRYRRMTSNLRKERREGRSGQFQAERLARFTGSRGRD